MMDLIYTVLYTHQKTKKAKTWQDGTLKVLATGTKAVLYDDKGSKLDVLHIHASDVVTGEQLESDRYFIQVEEIQKKSSPQAANTTVTPARPPQISHGPIAQQKADHYQALEAHAAQNAGFRSEGSGLKRKRSGFIPPRVVRPRTADNEISSPDADHVQPAAPPAYAPNRGPPAWSFASTSSASSDSSHERVLSGALFMGGRTTTLESAEKPQDSAVSFVSPQYKPQACVVTKTSPWRTIGSGLLKTSPVLHKLSSEWTSPMAGREQSIGRDVQSAWSLDKPSLSESDFVVKPQKTSNALSGSYAQSGLNQPLGKRSTSEIMALLGKNRHGAALSKTEDKLSNSENLVALQHFDKQSQVTGNKPLSVELKICEQSCEYDSGSLEEVISQKTLANANLQNTNMPQKSSPNLDHQDTNLKTSPACPCLGSEGKETNIFSDHPSMSSQNSEYPVTPKLSASTLSLSKHDFEMEEDFDSESVSSKSATVGFLVSSGDDHSQALSEADFSQANSRTDLKDEDKQDFSDSWTDWSGTNAMNKDVAEVTQEQRSNLSSKNADMNLSQNADSGSNIQNEENQDLHAEGHSQGESSLQFSSEAGHLTRDPQYTETAVDDTDACFELSYSPLSEVSDSDGEGFLDNDGGKCSQDTQHPLNTAVSAEQWFTDAPDKHLPAEQVSQMFEETLDPVDYHQNSEGRHPIDSEKVCQNTDMVIIQDADSVNNPQIRGGGVNVSETRKGDYASQVTIQENNTNSELPVEKRTSISKSENVRTGQTFQMEQDKFPGTMTTGECTKPLDASSFGMVNDTTDPLRTVNDLQISPDSFVPAEKQSSEVLTDDVMAVKTLCQSDQERDRNKENTLLSCDTCDADEEYNLQGSQSQTDTQTLTSIMVESSQEQVEAVASELSMPSPTSSCVSVATPDQHPMLNTSVQNSRYDGCVSVQDSPTESFQSTKPLKGSNKSEVGHPVHSNNLHQTHPSPQSLPYDYNIDHHHISKDSPVLASQGLPVHRPFQTVREVLGERGTAARQGPLHSVYEEVAGAVIQENRTYDKVQAGSWVESLTSDNADIESTDVISQPVSTLLPHPDQLVKGSALGSVSHRNPSMVTAPDIAETISARLTDYKMQGMLASNMVQRPMAYRCDVDYRQSSSPLVNSSSVVHRHRTYSVRSKGILDLSPGSVSSNIREAADQNLSSTGKTGFQMQTSGSAWTPESRLFSPAGEVLDTNESSMFIDWNGGKPYFIEPKENAQMKLLHDDTQQVPVFTDGLSFLQMSSQCPKSGSHTTSTQYSPTSHRPNSSCPAGVPLIPHRLKQQNSLQLCPRDCQAGGEKSDEYLNNCRDEEENGYVFGDGNLQTFPGMEEETLAASGIDTGFASRTSGIGEESTVSPVLFSQCVRSQVQAVSFNRTQRNRKLIPVVSAPDELATNESPQLRKENEVEDTVSVKGTSLGHKAAILSKQEMPVNVLEPFPLKTSSSDSLVVFDDKHSSTHCGKEFEENLFHSHVENLDFSGFMGSFPETDQEEGQELDVDSVSTLGKHTLHIKGAADTRIAEAWKDTDRDMKVDHTARLVFDSGESSSRTDAQKVSQSSSLAYQCSSSRVSSPRFVIADSGLDCIEEMEDDSPVAEHSTDEPQRSSFEQETNPLDNIQRQNKISKFAYKFQTSHPYVGKENQSRMNKGKAIKPFGSDSGYSQKSLRRGEFLAHEILAPSVPTDSPPLDITPERGVEKVLDFNKNNRQCQISQQTPSSATCPYVSKLGQTSLHHTRCPERTMQTQYKAPSPAVGTSGMSVPVMEETVPRTVASSRKVGLGKFRKPGVSSVGGCLPGSQFQSSLCHGLQFCSKEDVERQATPVRQVVIPPSFQTLVSYKQILTAALTEFLNIQLFTVAKTYHCALSKVDLTAYIEGAGAKGNLVGGSSNPACKCGSASKVAQVKKEGPNKGRFFYACSAPRDKQCKFFQWVDQQSSSASRGGGSGTSMVRPKFSDPASIMGYFRSQGLAVFCQCQFVRRTDKHNFKFGFPKWVRPSQSDSVEKKSIFIKLPKKDSTATHAKDDLWVVSKSLSFAKGETFVARSTFHGPNTHGEVAVDPVTGYSASLWTDGSVCHAVHCGNAATELACMSNIQDHMDMTSLPLLPHLLSTLPSSVMSSRMPSKGFKVPTTMQTPGKLHIPAQFVHDLADEFISKYQLNNDQAQAVRRVANMMDKDADPPSSVLLIHGVFGAGKSFLLSVVILFLVEVFQRNDTYCPGVPFPWKLLLSSTTNVAVDRVLQGLLELGFDDFVRVGSVKKIAKLVLPYSMHASGSDSQELKDLQEMLKSTDITSAEKHCIRKSIERHRLGENRKRLGAVRVVGVTCAACSFQCLDKMQFPFVVLDECSQMTEPSSLLPIARSACEKLVLVGDPKQLDPTLQGSEAAHGEGLEQTLFDRLMKMGHDPVMLRTQYRCHPTISAVSNALFYHGQLVDGVSPHHRQPILDLFPTMCFYDVSSGEETTDSSGSFTNEAEAQFVVLLLSVLMVQGLQPASVGVITLYRAQAQRILNIIRQSRGDAQREITGVQVSTVDAFQGGERDIIILSCVRTRNVGFIDSDKRMNVALTRARHHMLIVGHQRNLHSNRRWAEVLSHCQASAGGVVAAGASSRQLQAVLDQASEDQDSKPDDSPAKDPDQPQQAVARKRKSTPRKDVANSLAGQASIPPVTKTFIPALPVGSSNQMGSSLTGKVETEEETALSKSSGSSAGSSNEVNYKSLKKVRSRVKPLVIDDEEDKSDGSSDDDFLPDGLV